MFLRFGCTCIHIDHSESPNMRNKQYSLKVIVLGDSGVGKTTLLESYCNPDIVFHSKGPRRRPVRMEYDKSFTRDGDIVNLRIMDTGGQERYRSITASYFRDAHGCLLVFDLSNRRSMDNINSWLSDLKLYSSYDESMTTVLVGTSFKQKPREVTFEQGNNFANHLGLPYMEILSPDSTDIGAVFHLIADTFLENIKSRLANLQLQDEQDVRKLSRVYDKAQESFLTCQC